MGYQIITYAIHCNNDLILSTKCLGRRDNMLVGLTYHYNVSKRYQKSILHLHSNVVKYLVHFKIA
jgi:hypothetical protein